MRRLLALLAFTWGNATVAQEPPAPIVRVSLEPETVTVGEAAELRITVLGPTWFPEPPEFPSFEVPNALVRLPPNSSRATSERIGRDTWAGVTRRYEVYPLIGALFQLGGDVLKVTVANPGNPALNYALPIPDIELRAVVPDGAAGLDPFIAGTQFEVTREIDGDLDALESGSAVVLTYTAKLRGLHAIFIPSLAPAIEQDGLSVYRQSPEVEDATTARRREKVTLVFESGGEFTVPASRLEWWNTATSRIEMITLDAVTIRVDGPTPTEAEIEEPESGDSRGWAVGASLVLVAALLAGLSLPRVLAWNRQRQARIRASEAYAFKALQRSIRGGDTRAIHAAFLDWLARLDPALDSRGFAATYGDPELVAAVDSISRSRYGASATCQPNHRGLGHGLAVARKRCLNARNDARNATLPRLNP